MAADVVIHEITEDAVTRTSMERRVGQLSDEIKGHLDSAMEEVQKTVQDEAAVLLDSLEGSIRQQLEVAVRDLREMSRSTLQELRESIKVDAARSEAKVVQAVHAVEAQGVAWSAMSSENRRAFADLDRKLSLNAELDRKLDFDRKLALELAKSGGDDRQGGDPARSLAASSELRDEAAGPKSAAGAPEQEPSVAPAQPARGLKGMRALKRGVKSGEAGRIVDEMEAAEAADPEAVVGAPEQERFLLQLEASAAACEVLLKERVLPQLEAQQRQLADLAASSRGDVQAASGAAGEGASAGEGKAPSADTPVATEQTTRSESMEAPHPDSGGDAPAPTSVPEDEGMAAGFEERLLFLLLRLEGLVGSQKESAKEDFGRLEEKSRQFEAEVRALRTEVRGMRGDVGTPATLSSVQAHCCHIAGSSGRAEAAAGRLEASSSSLQEQLGDALSRLRRIDGRLCQLTGPDSAAAVAAGAAASVAGNQISERVGDVVARIRRLDAEQKHIRQAVEELGRHFVLMFGPRSEDAMRRDGPTPTPTKPARRSRPASAAATVPRGLGR